MAEGIRQGVDQRAARLLADADRRGHGPYHVLGLVQITELDEPGAVGEVAGHGVEQPERQPRLADAAGAAQRHRPHHVQEATQLADLGRTADETAELFRPAERPHYGSSSIRGTASGAWSHASAPTTVSPASPQDG